MKKSHFKVFIALLFGFVSLESCTPVSLDDENVNQTKIENVDPATEEAEEDIEGDD